MAVHKQLLVNESEYFKAAFDGAFMEASQCAIDLEEDDPAVVGWFVMWLYRGNVQSTDWYDAHHPPSPKRSWFNFTSLPTRSFFHVYKSRLLTL